MNPALAKQTLKIVSGLAFTFIIGSTYKMGKKVDEKIDEHFAPETPKSTEQNND